MKISLISFINRLDDEFSKARGAYIDHYQKAASCNAELAQLDSKRAEYSEAGYYQRVEDIRTRKNYAVEDMKAAVREFESAAAVIRKSCEKEFRPKYGITAEQVDDAALTLLRSGALSREELKQLAADYNENATMRRLIGSELYKDGDGVLPELGLQLIQSSQRTPHLDTFDSLKNVCTLCLRVDTDGIATIPVEDGFGKSNAVYKELYDGALAKAMKAAETIEINV